MSRTTSLIRKISLKSSSSRLSIIPQCYSLYPHQRRSYASYSIPPNAPNEGESVAILGGGITGLVSAFELSGRRPDLKITLFEGSNRLGGWLHSTSVDVGTGKVVFEQGPRNLRPSWPNGYITLDLVSCEFLLSHCFIPSYGIPLRFMILLFPSFTCWKLQPFKRYRY